MDRSDSLSSLSSQTSHSTVTSLSSDTSHSTVTSLSSETSRSTVTSLSDEPASTMEKSSSLYSLCDELEKNTLKSSSSVSSLYSDCSAKSSVSSSDFSTCSAEHSAEDLKEKLTEVSREKDYLIGLLRSKQDFISSLTVQNEELEGRVKFLAEKNDEKRDLLNRTTSVYTPRCQDFDSTCKRNHEALAAAFQQVTDSMEKMSSDLYQEQERNGRLVDNQGRLWSQIDGEKAKISQLKNDHLKEVVGYADYIENLKKKVGLLPTKKNRFMKAPNTLVDESDDNDNSVKDQARANRDAATHEAHENLVAANKGVYNNMVAANHKIYVSLKAANSKLYEELVAANHVVHVDEITGKNETPADVVAVNSEAYTSRIAAHEEVYDKTCTANRESYSNQVAANNEAYVKWTAARDEGVAIDNAVQIGELCALNTNELKLPFAKLNVLQVARKQMEVVFDSEKSNEAAKPNLEFWCTSLRDAALEEGAPKKAANMTAALLQAGVVQSVDKKLADIKYDAMDVILANAVAKHAAAMDAQTKSLVAMDAAHKRAAAMKAAREAAYERQAAAGLIADKKCAANKKGFSIGTWDSDFSS